MSQLSSMSGPPEPEMDAETTSCPFTASGRLPTGTTSMPSSALICSAKAAPFSGTMSYTETRVSEGSSAAMARVQNLLMGPAAMTPSLWLSLRAR